MEVKLPLYLFVLIFYFSHEVVAQRCSVKKVFLEISENLQENTCARVSFLIKLQVQFFEISRTPFLTEHLRWPISLLPIFGKIFEKIIFNRTYNFLLEEDPNQSGFRPFVSCMNRLLTIIHKIFEAFDCNPSLEVRSVSLDISKAIDKVWHKGLLFKLKSMGISGDLFNLLENYLSGRLQRVALNEQTSSWRPVLAGVPQSSILGPLLFQVYINDLPNELKSNAKPFADMSLFTIVKDKQESADVLNNDLSLTSKWAFNWKMLINPDTFFLF